MRKLMFTILTGIAAALTPALNAENAYVENAFVDGTVWDMISYPCDPASEPGHFTYKLDGVREVGGYEAMRMYEGTKFVSFVRTEGDKVYFTYEEENPEWYLCFDFGMKPGDEQICYNMFDKHPSDAMLMRCVAETIVSEYGDYPALEMVQVIDGEEYRVTEMWFKGVGSQSGPDISSWAGLVGGGADIMRVTNGDRVILEKEGSGIAAPTVEHPQGAAANYNLQGVRVDNPSGGVFIRVEDGKTSKVLIK